MNDWITNNYPKIIKACKNISKNNEYEDLCQSSIEQFLMNGKSNEIPDHQKLFFLVRIIQNNFNSTTSPYYKEYHKYKFDEMNPNMDLQQDEYEEPDLTIEWVIEQIEMIKEQDWYLGTIFLHWIKQDCNLTKLNKLTGIPMSNLSRDIKKVKQQLNKLYKEKTK